mmetsp:Transcript_19337/g.23028  ORF Transcript_19337/g.23028 Transcript_19337/m.23028 type:complete len:92 (+) Transcript_19337:332-607(+)
MHSDTFQPDNLTHSQDNESYHSSGGIQSTSMELNMSSLTTTSTISAHASMSSQSTFTQLSIPSISSRYTISTNTTSICTTSIPNQKATLHH